MPLTGRDVLWVAILVTSPVFEGCADVSCGPHQEVTEDELCACVSGFELEGQTCVPIPPLDAGTSLDAGLASADTGVQMGGESADAGGTSSLGESCTSEDDCGPDAPFCDTFQYNMCLIRECTIEPESCPDGWMCCDFSRFGLEEQLCVPAGECPTR